MSKRSVVLYLLILIYTSILPTNVFAGSVSSVNVWIGRVNDLASGTQTYAFYTDIWGTVNEFQTINIISPLGNSYPLVLAPEGDQWGSGVTGTQSAIESEFTDGTYTFNVTYTDLTTDSRQVVLAGVLPDYPDNIALNGNTISWDAWSNPQFPVEIEIYIVDSNDNYIFDADISYTDTSYNIPAGVINANENYVIGVSFVSSAMQDGFKASATELVVSIPGGSSDGGGGAPSFYFVYLLLILLTRRIKWLSKW